MTTVDREPNAQVEPRVNVADLLAHFELPGPYEAELGAQGIASSPHLSCFNPGDGSLLARLQATSAAEYELIMTGATAAAASWAEVPAPQRGELVRQLADELRDNRQQLAALISLENGKIIAEARGEVQE